MASKLHILVLGAIFFKNFNLNKPEKLGLYCRVNRIHTIITYTTGDNVFNIIRSGTEGTT